MTRAIALLVAVLLGAALAAAPRAQGHQPAKHHKAHKAHKSHKKSGKRVIRERPAVGGVKTLNLTGGGKPDTQSPAQSAPPTPEPEVTKATEEQLSTWQPDAGWTRLQDGMSADCDAIAEDLGGGTKAWCADMIDQRGGWDNGSAMLVVAVDTGNPDFNWSWNVEVKAHACVDAQGKPTGGIKVEDAYWGMFRDDCPDTIELPGW